MSRYLLDSHVLLWWSEDPSLLTAEARHAIANGRHMVFVSAATIWELGINQASGKLKAPEDVRTLVNANRFDILPISADHAHFAPLLPAIHADPFDRMLVAQATEDRLTLITRDRDIAKYDVPILVG